MHVGVAGFSAIMLMGMAACSSAWSQPEVGDARIIRIVQAFAAQAIAARLDAFPESDHSMVVEWEPGRREGRLRDDQGWQPAGAAALVQAVGAEMLASAKPGMRGLWLSPLVWLECGDICLAYPISESQWVGGSFDQAGVDRSLPLVVVLKDGGGVNRELIYGEISDYDPMNAHPVFAADHLLGPAGWNWYVGWNDASPMKGGGGSTGSLIISVTAMILLMAIAAFLVMLSRRDKRRAEEQIRFVASATHELRTPLSIIDGAADSLAEGIVKDSSGVREYGDLIRSESRRLANLVNNVLQFSSASQQLFNVESIDVSSWIRSSISLAGADAAGISVAIADDLPLIRGNRAALESLLVNLISNALKYSEDGSASMDVQAILRPGGQQALAVSITNRVAGRIETDVQEWFEPFRRGRTGRERPGTGLGLSVARTIARQHGGDISLRVADNQVRFTVFLPEAANE